MPLQTMSDNCDLQIDSQFAQGNRHHIEAEKPNVFAAKVSTVLDDSATDPPPFEAPDSTTMNGDFHLEWDNVQPEKQPAIQSSELNDATLDESIITENHIPSTIDDDFCDFEGYADFGCNTSQTNDNNSTEFANFTSSNVKSDNFANFDHHHSNWSTSVVDNQVSSAVEDDGFSDEDFADFKCASNDRQSTQPAPPTQPAAPSVNTETDWTQLFRNTFPETVHFTGQSPESDSSSSTGPTGQIFDHGAPGSEAFWDSLQEMDLKSICLLNKWKNSHSFKRLLQALKVDGNIIQMHADIFPTYSSNFGQILEPISANSWGQMVQESTNTSNPSDSTTARTKAIESTVAASDGDFQSVFSLNQDLDFFESKYTYKNSTQNAKSDDLISEFESIILDGDSGQQPQPDQHFEFKQGASTLASPISSVNDLRKMLQSTIAKTNNEQVLSAEALQILNELPSLSFVRANVLMFPINEQNG